MAVLQAANRFTAENNLILTSMYVIIPTVLGAPATYLIGRGTVETAVTSYYAGIKFFEDAAEFTVAAGPVLAAAGSAIASAGAALGGAIIDAIMTVISWFF